MIFISSFFSLKPVLLSSLTVTLLHQDFCYEPWCVFFLAPWSVSSVPLLYYRSTAPLSPTLKGMQTHIKRGSPLEDFRALRFLLSSFLSYSHCNLYAGRRSSRQRTHTHTHTNRDYRWGRLPLHHLWTSLLRFLMEELKQRNTTTIKSQSRIWFHMFCDVDMVFLRAEFTENWEQFIMLLLVLGWIVARNSEKEEIMILPFPSSSFILGGEKG